MGEFVLAEASALSAPEPKSASQASGPRIHRKRRRDPLALVLGAAVFLVGALLVSAVFYVVYAGVVRPAAPRTAQERQLQLLSEVVKKNPKSDAAWADYAQALIAAQQLSRAERTVNEGLQAVPGAPKILVQQANLLVAREKPDEALKTVAALYKTIDQRRATRKAALAEKSVTEDLGLLDVDEAIAGSILKASIYEDKKDWKNAVAAYDRALKEDPTMTDTLTLRGFAKLNAGDKAGAVKDFETALTFVPDYKAAVEGLQKAKGER